MSNDFHFSRLFRPGRIGQMELRNRIVMPPMVTNFATKDGYVTEQLKKYYEARAQGGAALIILEAVYFHPQGRGYINELSITDDKFIPGLSELAQAIQRHGAKASLQITHDGRNAHSHLTGTQPVAPSPIPNPGGEMPKELTVGEIAEIIGHFAQAARLSKKAGFDAVQINTGAGSLLGQFVSRAFNKREDAYGGDLGNRARFLVEVVKAVRQAVGVGYPIECKMTGKQYGIENGITLEEAQQVVRMAQDAGADAISVTALGSFPSALAANIPLEPIFVELAAGIKKVVTVPVIAVGRIDLELGERILQEEKADLIAMGRALIADPELPNKVISGRLDDITPCIVCMRCLDKLFIESPIDCTVNARVGREAEYTIEPAKKPKKVFVIGGGAAGMEAARVAASRGYKVTLYEKESKLGGQLISATIAPHKDRTAPLTRYLEAQVKKLDVKVELGKEVTAALLEEVNPDVVVLATGATPIIPEIPGAKGDNVVTAVDVLTGRKKVGEVVVVVGGGMIGCETAEFLADKGKRVTILEMLEEMGSDIGPALRPTILERLKNASVRMETGVKAVEITEKGVRGMRDSTAEFFEGDTLVLAVGMEPSKGLAQSLKGKVKELYLIGDCVEPRKIVGAIDDGFRVGREI